MALSRLKYQDIFQIDFAYPDMTCSVVDVGCRSLYGSRYIEVRNGPGSLRHASSLRNLI